MPRSRRTWRGPRAAGPAMLALATLLLAVARSWQGPAAADGSLTGIHAVASTNVYGDVLAQIGGRHVVVFSILNNPNADPHTFETSTADAAAVEHATLLVRNGLGYDEFITKLQDAAPSSHRVVLDAGTSLGYRDGDNPHIWYDPGTMPRVAALIAAELRREDPAHGADYAANLRAFDRSLQPWTALLSALRRQYAGAPVAVTEPVFGYELQALGLKTLTPEPFAMAIMQGNDPSPQDAQTQEDLFLHHRIRGFFYNQQAVAPITHTLLALARTQRLPVVGVYETKPAHRSYQQWMLAETEAVQLALARGSSTESIQ